MSSTPNAQHPVIKIILIGDSGVGKSCLLKAFMGDVFKSGYTSTIGVDFEIKPVELPCGAECNLQIWDTAGQERFRSIVSSYYRSADIALLVFDITDQHSFDSLTAWLADIERYASRQVEIALVGNKCDLEGKRQISFETAKAFAAEHNCALFHECSAKQRINVEKIFMSVLHNAQYTQTANTIQTQHNTTARTLENVANPIATK